MSLLAFGAIGVQAAEAVKLQVQRNGKITRFIFLSHRKLNFKVLHLQNPPRVAIDLTNARLVSSVAKKQLMNTPVKAVRLGHPRPHVLRLVLDLKDLIPMRTFRRRQFGFNEHALVVELLAASPTSRQRLDTATGLPKSFSNVLPWRASRKVVVVLDPGHGGKDPGATGQRGTHEKNVVLIIARQLQRAINRQPGFKAVLTRTSDYYIPLRKRLAIARDYKADMFVSVHADAYRNHEARGASVYALSERGATSEAARWLAQRENESELMGGVDLSDKNNMLKSVLINLAQTAAIRTSLHIGQSIIHILSRFTPLHNPRVGQAAFVVLKSPDVPSLLIETGFISNIREERNLNSRYFRQKLARAITKGVVNYYVNHPPRGTWLAQQKKHRKG